MSRFFFPPAGGAAGGGVTVSATEPASPSQGDLWYNSDTGETKVYVGEAFVTILPAHDDWDLTH